LSKIWLWVFSFSPSLLRSSTIYFSEPNWFFRISISFFLSSLIFNHQNIIKGTLITNLFDLINLSSLSSWIRFYHQRICPHWDPFRSSDASGSFCFSFGAWELISPSTRPASSPDSYLLRGYPSQSSLYQN
jgi:hypothetical protein